jgi:hypothetical protein
MSRRETSSYCIRSLMCSIVILHQMYHCNTVYWVFSVSSYELKYFLRQAKYNFFLFFISTWSVLFNQCHLQITARSDPSSAFYLHPWSPIDFRTFSVQSKNYNFGPPDFLLPSNFPRITLFMAFLPTGQPTVAFLITGIPKIKMN